MKRRPQAFWLVMLAAVLFVSARPAYAQVFSPGELNRVHIALDSMSSCDQCHTGQQKVDRSKCLTCHELIDKAVKTRQGLHGQPDMRAKTCEQCHTEHKGRTAPIIAWPGGRPERFRHQQSGWPLKGAHAVLECQKCHDLRRIEVPAILDYLKKHKKQATFMGLETACTACHFDEHRGAFKDTCETCHLEQAWKPAPSFQHDKFWKLEGAHARVDCAKCHAQVKDPAFQANAFPKPRAATYMKMAGLEHDQCTDCHTDPHRSRFGNSCTKCHTVQSWAVSDNAGAVQDVAFHDRTAYPLVGRHRAVDCDSCHIKDRSGRKVLKPIPHDRCVQCHPSAHPEVTRDGADRGVEKDCDACHTLEGFTPVNFTPDDHEKTRWPLRESHQAESCAECHQKSLGPARAQSRPQPVRGFLATRVISSWLLEAQNKQLEPCQSCHTSPHREQFADRTCTECHTQVTWKNSTTFDHAKTKYPLEGKHKEVACALCHVSGKDAAGTFVRYRPLRFDDCTPCHGDAHYGQFARLSPELTCKQCHSVNGFKDLLFQHNRREFSDFPLEGKHEKSRCQQCHPSVQLAADLKAQRFRPTPQQCELCHVDPHKGAYREAARLVQGRQSAADPGSGAAPLAMARAEGESQSPVASVPGNGLAVPGDGLAVPGNGPAVPGNGLAVSPGAAGNGRLEQAAAWTLPAQWRERLGGTSTDCQVCHEARSWRDIRFDHSATGFVLRGQHKQAPCQGCHLPGNPEKVATECAACHENVHQGEVGYTCQECHNEDSFRRPIMPIARHARSSFPLLGRHAVTNCRECHQDVRGVSFEQTPTDCAACHEQALLAVNAGAIDHSSFSTRCGQCHTPLSWQSANYLQHGRCFPINPGSEHWGIACASCHPGAMPAVTGTCSDTGVSCVQCHGCEEGRHRDVKGYECADQKCYQCHPGGTR